MTEMKHIIYNVTVLTKILIDVFSTQKGSMNLHRELNTQIDRFKSEHRKSK